MTWNSPPYAVRVVRGDGTAAGLEREARADGGCVIDIDVAGVPDENALELRLREVFRFPHPTVGFDAAIDLMSDLDWMPSKVGYLLRVTGLDFASSEVAGTLASLLPSVVDRWRSQQIPFVAVLVCASARPAVVPAVRASNQFLADAGSYKWSVADIAPVPMIVDGVPDTVSGT